MILAHTQKQIHSLFFLFLLPFLELAKKKRKKNIVVARAHLLKHTRTILELKTQHLL